MPPAVWQLFYVLRAGFPDGRWPKRTGRMKRPDSAMIFLRIRAVRNVEEDSSRFIGEQTEPDEDRLGLNNSQRDTMGIVVLSP